MNATLLNCLKSHELADPLAEDEAAAVASALSDSSSLQVYPRSISCARNAVFFLGRKGRTSRSGLFIPIRTREGGFPLGFHGSSQKINIDGHSLTLCETTPENAAALARSFRFSSRVRSV